MDKSCDASHPRISPASDASVGGNQDICLSSQALLEQ